MAVNREFKYKLEATRMLADTITPVKLYLGLRDRYPNSLLLESADYRGSENSFSFICCDELASFEVDNGRVLVRYPGGKPEHFEGLDRQAILGLLDDFRSTFKVETPKGIPNVSGLFGYCSHNAVQHFEDITLKAVREADRAIPEIRYGVYRYVIAINHFKDELHLLEHVRDGEKALEGERALNIDALSRKAPAQFSFRAHGEETSNFTDEEHAEVIRQCKKHIMRGDIFQIVPSRRFAQPFEGDDFNVYRALRSINPSPYLFFFDYGDYRIFGSSPEAQLIIKGGKATIYPIAGTYRRTGDDKADLAAAEDLKNDPKESAEHVMLVDLARNDLSRHCKEVSVEAFKEVHFYSHVIHLVSKVTGWLRTNASPIDVMSDTFPAGTLSGAPKYRALELIDTYERGSREYYGGALGFFGFDGECNHCIMIRSFFSRNGVLVSQTGGGVVADSVEESEVQEVRNKRAALRAAITMAEEL